MDIVTQSIEFQHTTSDGIGHDRCVANKSAVAIASTVVGVGVEGVVRDQAVGECGLRGCLFGGGMPIVLLLFAWLLGRILLRWLLCFY